MRRVRFILETGSVWHGSPHGFVVPIATAVAVAKDFLRCKNLPTSAEWFEL